MTATGFSLFDEGGKRSRTRQCKYPAVSSWIKKNYLGRGRWHTQRTELSCFCSLFVSHWIWRRGQVQMIYRTNIMIISLSQIFTTLAWNFLFACFQVHALAFIMECQHTVVVPRVVQCWVAPKEALWSLALALLAIDFGVQWIFHTCGMLDWC